MSFTKIDHYEKEYADTHHDTALNVTEGVEDQPIISPYFKLAQETYAFDRRVRHGHPRGQHHHPLAGHHAGPNRPIRRTMRRRRRSSKRVCPTPGIRSASASRASGSRQVHVHRGHRQHGRIAAPQARGAGHRPSSERSGGSILGDKTRMESICNNPSVFVRPSLRRDRWAAWPARRAKRSCCARLPGSMSSSSRRWASGSRRPPCIRWWTSSCCCRSRARGRIAGHQARHHGDGRPDGHHQGRRREHPQGGTGADAVPKRAEAVPGAESGWRPKVYTSSAVARTGLEEVWKGVEEYLDHIEKNGYFQHNRNRQNKYWMYRNDP